MNDTEDACKNYTYIDCDYYLGRLPESSDYAAFTGAFGLVAAAVGLVGAVVSAIPWFVALIFDVLAAIFYLAGGIVSITASIRLWDVTNVRRTWPCYEDPASVTPRSVGSGLRALLSCSSPSSPLWPASRL